MNEENVKETETVSILDDDVSSSNGSSNPEKDVLYVRSFSNHSKFPSFKTKRKEIKS